MQMIREPNEHSKPIRLNFYEGKEGGLKGILYGKGLSFSLTYFLMISLFLTIFFFLLPFEVELGLLLFRMGIILASLGLSYIFVKSIVGIVLEEDNIQFAIFKKYKRYLIEKIRIIKIYYFTLWGLGAIYLKTQNGSDVFFVLAPNFQRERYNLFFEFTKTLRENPGLAGRVRFKS